MKRVLQISTLLMALHSTANSQTLSTDFTELDPNIVAAANCNGQIFAVAMQNFEAGVLSEERARIMLRTTLLSFYLTAIKYQNQQQLEKYQVEYDKIIGNSYDFTYTTLYNGTFDWAQQAEADACAARLFESLTSIPIDQLNSAGIDYFVLIEDMKEEANRRFDYLLKLAKAME